MAHFARLLVAAGVVDGLLRSALACWTLSYPPHYPGWNRELTSGSSCSSLEGACSWILDGTLESVAWETPWPCSFCILGEVEVEVVVLSM